MGRLEAALIEVGGTMLITADHGNAEDMTDEINNQPHTQHTLAPVPFIAVNPPDGVARVTDGVLADVAPTVLELMQLTPPSDMTGRSLIERRVPAAALA
jgi:2,3-bisphosphoglycerate-independent phosphoglycerate mutase